MEKSLDVEPPSTFHEGKKEVNKKENGILPRLILSSKNKNKTKRIIKNLEKKIISNSRKNISEKDYLETSQDYLEESLILNNISEFTAISINFNKIINKSDYTEKENNVDSIKDDLANFYMISSSYSFIMIKENKREKPEDLKKFEETKEFIYPLYQLEGEQN
jgi:hypothetical protein